LESPGLFSREMVIFAEHPCFELGPLCRLSLMEVCPIGPIKGRSVISARPWQCQECRLQRSKRVTCRKQARRSFGLLQKRLETEIQAKCRDSDEGVHGVLVSVPSRSHICSGKRGRPGAFPYGLDRHD